MIRVSNPYKDIFLKVSPFLFSANQTKAMMMAATQPALDCDISDMLMPNVNPENL